MMKTMYPGMVNSPITEITAAITATQTSITVLNGAALPAAPNLFVIGQGELAETVVYTTKSGNTLSGLTRGLQGTARAWPSGTKLSRNFTDYDYGALVENILEAFEELESKAGITTATSEAKGLMSNTDKTKLDGVAANANNYSHPANHPPSIISQDANNRFATDAELNKLSGIATGAQVNRAQATTVQATAGTDTTTDMSPARTINAIDSRTRYGVTTGSATALVLTLSPAPASLYNGIEVKVKLHVATSTNPTLNVNGLGAKALYDGEGARFSNGESGKIYAFIYDGTNFILRSGGGGGKLNVYGQSSQPIKKKGIWQNNANTITNIVSDTNVYNANEWNPVMFAPFGPPGVTSWYNNEGFAIGDNIHMMGGYTATYSAHWRYNTLTGVWTSMAPFPYNAARTEIKGVVVNGEIYLRFSSGASLGYSTEFYKYSPANNTWTVLASFPQSCISNALVSLGNKIYTFGGRTSSALDQVYSYDIATNTWTYLVRMPVAKVNVSLGTFGGKIFITSVANLTCYRYDPVTNTFETITGPATQVTGGVVSYTQVDKYLYICGNNLAGVTCVFDMENLTSVLLPVIPSGSQPAATPNFICWTGSNVIWFGGAREANALRNLVANRFMLTSKPYPEGTLIIIKTDNLLGSFATELLTPGKELVGQFNQMQTGFDDTSFFHGGTHHRNLPTYHGTGSAWVKFK